MKLTTLAAITGAVILGLVPSAQAFTLDAINLTTDNGAWPSVPAGFVSGSAYDGFTLTVSGTPGELVSEISLEFAFTGLFDDSVALDLDGDGTIDFAVDYWDAAATALSTPDPSYSPWSDPSDVARTVTTFTITPTGSSATVSLDGVPVVLGLADTLGGFPQPSASFSNLASITLEDLGFDPGGLIPGSGVVTTSEMRFGYINTAGPGGGRPNITPESFSVVKTTPEPSSMLALLGLASLGITALKRKPKDSEEA